MDDVWLLALAAVLAVAFIVYMFKSDGAERGVELPPPAGGSGGTPELDPEKAQALRLFEERHRRARDKALAVKAEVDRDPAAAAKTLARMMKK